jgi:hypothetical protein
VGALNPANYAGAVPTAAVPQVLYAGGVLRFDADGTGGAAAVIVAALAGAPALAAADIVVIA